MSPEKFIQGMVNAFHALCALTLLTFLAFLLAGLLGFRPDWVQEVTVYSLLLLFLEGAVGYMAITFHKAISWWRGTPRQERKRRIRAFLEGIDGASTHTEKENR